ncbi:hypothetical protein [Spirosoma endophyticum]|uniref:Uncharacterized protein n=1 Tax=Spirosoma endophyticum TaxID=662367 RepID=A0A1I2GL94_9BACT|nr:hypothetical protein [Spirosoma endophyticum]SFF17770.1 hypothetical protein SAMN05216167_13326 [Spirosoma endophyticum]
MKKNIPALLILIGLVSTAQMCGKKDDVNPEFGQSSCGVKNPAKDLPWLKDIITKANEDKATMAHQGNYMGSIYLESLRDEPVFLVKMMMGSGGLAGYFFRCDGQRVYPTAEEITTVVAGYQNKKVVYANLP